MSTAAAEPAPPVQTSAGSAPSLLIGSILGSVVILAGFVAGGYAAAAVPETVAYAEVVRIGIYLLTVGLGVFIGGALARMNAARGVSGGIILTVSIVVAAAFIAAACYSGFPEGWVGVVLVGLVAVVALVGIYRILTSAQGRGWCAALEDQGWASFHSHKRSQGLIVRRLTLAAILILGGTGAFSLGFAKPFAAKRPVVGTDAKARDAAQQPTEEKLPPPFHYHVPFTEVVDAGGYQLKADGNAKTSLDVENALKKFQSFGKEESALAEAAVVVTTGDEKNDRVTAFVQMRKDANGKTPAATEELKKDLRDEVNKATRSKKDDEATGLPPENVTLTFVDAVMKSPRSGQVNRRFYHELLANREANADATTLLPLVPVANYTFPVLLLLVTLWGAWRAVNVPTFGDFLIATEAEMNKVSWTTRKRLVQDTIVVLVFLALLTVFLLVIDLFWGWLLSQSWIGVLPAKPTGTEANTAGGNLKW